MKPSALSHKMRGLLKCRRGESLMEGIVSILVFTVLIAAVTTTLTLSLRISSSSVAESTRMQEKEVNALVLRDTTKFLRAEVIEFTFSDLSVPIDVPVRIYGAGNFVIFEPQ